MVVVPTLFITYLYGDSGMTRLLLVSQVMLSLQLPFAMVPLIRFTSSTTIMGQHVNPRWMTLTAWTMMVLVTAMNLVLTYKALVS
jgi:manganese transport protein